MPYIETNQIRPAPVALWAEIQYHSGQHFAEELRSLRCHNTATVPVRVEVAIGWGSNLKKHTVVVQPGEDRIYPQPGSPEASLFPVNMRNADVTYGVSQA